MNADFHLLVWILSWDAHALVTAPFRIFSANVFYPAPWSLAYSEHLFGLVPLFAPTYWLTSNPILATNVVIFTTQILATLAMYALARRWTSGPAAAVGAFFFAASGWRMANMAYFHIYANAWMPLVVLFTERWLDTRRRRDLAVVTIALVIQTLTSVYLAYAVLVLWAAQLGVAASTRPHLGRSEWLGILFAGATTLVIFGIACIPYLRLRVLGVIPAFGSSPAQYTLTEMGLRPYFAASAVAKFFEAQSVGWVGGVLVVVGLLQRDSVMRRAAILGAIVALVGTVLAFGPGIFVAGRVLWSPYRILQAVLPGFGTIRLPVRFLVITQVGLALLAALGASRAFASLRLSAVAASAVASALVATTLVLAPLPTLPLHEEIVGSAVPPAYRWLAKNGAGGALLELPRAELKARARRMYLSTYHWLPTIDGYSAYPVRTTGYLYSIARALPDEDALQALVDNVDVQWILVHLAEMPDANLWLHGQLPVGLERIGRWDDDLLLRVRRPVDAADVRERLLSTEETIGGVPLAPIVGECPGALFPVGPVRYSPSGDEARVTVGVRNDSTKTWPGFGLVPRHLVYLRTRVLDMRNADPIHQFDTPVGRDLEPGATASVNVQVPLRSRELPQILEFELVQVGDGSLVACGVSTLPVKLEVPSVPRA